MSQSSCQHLNQVICYTDGHSVCIDCGLVTDNHTFYELDAHIQLTVDYEYGDYLKQLQEREKRKLNSPYGNYFAEYYWNEVFRQIQGMEPEIDGDDYDKIEEMLFEYYQERVSTSKGKTFDRRLFLNAMLGGKFSATGICQYLPIDVLTDFGGLPIDTNIITKQVIYGICRKLEKTESTRKIKYSRYSERWVQIKQRFFNGGTGFGAPGTRLNWVEDLPTPTEIDDIKGRLFQINKVYRLFKSATKQTKTKKRRTSNLNLAFAVRRIACIMCHLKNIHHGKLCSDNTPTCMVAKLGWFFKELSTSQNLNKYIKRWHKCIHKIEKYGRMLPPLYYPTHVYEWFLADNDQIINRKDFCKKCLPKNSDSLQSTFPPVLVPIETH
jgi:hypothetical protein